MELTLSIPILAGHRDRHEVLWYAPDSDGGRVYWNPVAFRDADSVLASPADLLLLAPETGSRTLNIEVLGWSATDHWAVHTWLNRDYDLIIIEGFPRWPPARLFGPLHHEVRRYQIGGACADKSLDCLLGGLWHWISADSELAMSTSWTGAMGMML